MSRDGACCGAIAMLVDGDLYQFVFFCFLTNPMGAIFSNNEGSGVGALRIYFLLDLFMDLYHLKSHVIHGGGKYGTPDFFQMISVPFICNKNFSPRMPVDPNVGCIFRDLKGRLKQN